MMKKESNMALHSKSKVADYIYCHSHFLHSCLVQCEELYQHDMGFSCMMVLFNCLENISRSVLNDYTLNLYDIFSSLHEKGYLSLKEYEFLNKGDFCLRKIRNLYAHKNAAAICFVEFYDGREHLWPLTENDTSLMLYEKISDITFNLMGKIVAVGFIDTVKEMFQQPLDDYIDECIIHHKSLTSKELLVLKGYPEDYIPDDTSIPEDARIRIVDCAPDLNATLSIYSRIMNLLQTEKDSGEDQENQ